MDLAHILKQYFGFDSFLPLQEEAMGCILSGRDSLVVLPTGGGKSLCFQAPALAMEGLAVVVSPLISLMKDQVDALRETGIETAFFNSSLATSQRREVINRIRSGLLRILYVAPERLVMEDFLALLKTVPVSFFAVDEAHCISMWGHDFRPEYRALQHLKEHFPKAGVHAYTATATAQVRDDIHRSLGLVEPAVLVGSFDRPNLIYKVERRTQRIEQIVQVLERHASESCIIYCIRRSDVDRVNRSLQERGFRSLPYHAGLTDHDRKTNQEAFLREKADVMVATVAFGMGIDKSNVRCVIHAGAPKSLEHYQQETGRAGRDGLEAECRLFFSGGDFSAWAHFLHDMDPEPQAVAQQKLNQMYAYCSGIGCRHRSLLNYFGQEAEQDDCGACDVCLGEINQADDPLILGQKILSCVVRLRERFGADYTAQVLCGSEDKRILQSGHDRLSTWGLLSEEGKRNVRDWIEQLVDQDCLERVGDYPILRLTDKGRRVLKGEETPCLLKPAAKPVRAAKISQTSWEGVDQGLFEKLRQLRAKQAAALGKPAYVVFGDAALRDMSRKKPLTVEAFLDVHGVGKKKCETYGPAFMEAIAAHLAEEAEEG